MGMSRRTAGALGQRRVHILLVGRQGVVHGLALDDVAPERSGELRVVDVADAVELRVLRKLKIRVGAKGLRPASTALNPRRGRVLQRVRWSGMTRARRVAPIIMNQETRANR